MPTPPTRRLTVMPSSRLSSRPKSSPHKDRLIVTRPWPGVCRRRMTKKRMSLHITLSIPLIPLSQSPSLFVSLTLSLALVVASNTHIRSPEQLPPPFRFTYRHAPPTSHHPSLFGYDNEDETRSLNFPHAQQWDQLSALNTLLRSTGAPPEEPLFQHLQELMQRTRHRNTATLPRQRYVFPGNVFNVQGVEVCFCQLILSAVLIYNSRICHQVY